MTKRIDSLIRLISHSTSEFRARVCFRNHSTSSRSAFTHCRPGWSFSQTKTSRLPPGSDELQHDFAPVRPGTVLHNVDALPCAKREGAINHRHVQRHAGEHRLYVRRHIVQPFDIMNPASI